MGRRLAFLIGNQTFRPDAGLEPLHGPSNDVGALAKLFGNPAIGAFTVETFVDQRREDILPAIDEALGRTERDDLVIIYYAGHGILDGAGRLCLATSETRRGARYATSIPAQSLRDIIASSRCDAVVLLLDCCYSGAIGGETRGDVDSQIALMRQVSGLYILTASTGVQTAGESEVSLGGVTMGRFTAAIVQGIESGEADRDRDGCVMLTDLNRHVQERVRGQTPQFWAHAASGDPLIARVNHQATSFVNPGATQGSDTPTGQPVFANRVEAKAPFPGGLAVGERERPNKIRSRVLSIASGAVGLLVIGGSAYLLAQRQGTESIPSRPSNVIIRSSRWGEALCMDLASGGTPRAGQLVVGWHCHGDYNQRWIVDNVGQGQATLVSFGGLCLDLRRAQTNAQVTVAPCHNSSSQRFVLRGDGTIQQVQTGECLIGNYPPEGAQITLGSCTRDPNAYWDIH